MYKTLLHTETQSFERKLQSVPIALSMEQFEDEGFSSAYVIRTQGAACEPRLFLACQACVKLFFLPFTRKKGAATESYRAEQLFVAIKTPVDFYD